MDILLVKDAARSANMPVAVTIAGIISYPRNIWVAYSVGVIPRIPGSTTASSGRFIKSQTPAVMTASRV